VGVGVGTGVNVDTGVGSIVVPELESFRTSMKAATNIATAIRMRKRAKNIYLFLFI
jgi:hypothetical protein